MKGVIFNLLEDAVAAHFGASVWDNVLNAAELEGAYTSLGSYPDSELTALVAAASDNLSLSPPVMLRWFGRNAMPLLAQRYPAFFEPSNVRNFLLSVNTIIHHEVRKLYTGAGCPHFQFQEPVSGELVIGYSSPRRLCALAEGFIDGAAAHYGETVEVNHPTCMHTGSPSCTLVIRWES